MSLPKFISFCNTVVSKVYKVPHDEQLLLFKKHKSSTQLAYDGFKVCLKSIAVRYFDHLKSGKAPSIPEVSKDQIAAAVDNLDDRQKLDSFLLHFLKLGESVYDIKVRYGISLEDQESKVKNLIKLKNKYAVEYKPDW